MQDVKNLQRSRTELSKSEFVLILLHMMNKIEKKVEMLRCFIFSPHPLPNPQDVLLVSSVFDGMDKNESGILDQEEIEIEALRARERAQIKLEEQAKASAEQAASLAGQVLRTSYIVLAASVARLILYFRRRLDCSEEASVYSKKS